MSTLSVRKLALSFGIFWGATVLAMGLAATYSTYGTGFVEAISSLYFGYYTATVTGSIIGGIIGFVDGAVCGSILAWLYNRV